MGRGIGIQVFPPARNETCKTRRKVSPIMLKMNRIGKRLALLLVVCMAVMAMAVPAAADTTERTFVFTTSGNSTAEAYIPAQDKSTPASIYCYVMHSSNSNVTTTRGNVRGAVGGTAYSTWPLCNSGGGNNRRLAIGTEYLLYNSVNEAGYTKATIGLTTNITCQISGSWCPDGGNLSRYSGSTKI